MELAIFKPNLAGVFEGVPMEVYQKAPGVSKSMLDTFRDCPLKAYEAQRGFVQKPTRAMIIGSLTDAAIFEPDEFESKYHLEPASYENNKGKVVKWNNNSTTCKAWKLARKDRPVINSNELITIKRMMDAVWNDKHAADLLRRCRFQVSLFAMHNKTGLLRKGRPDGMWNNYILDLKKLADASTSALSRAIAEYHYYVQAAYYLDLAQANGIDATDFYFIAVEPGDRPKVNVRLLTQSAIDLGRFVYERDLEKWNECETGHVWPSYSEVGEIGYVDVPEWLSTKIMGDMPLTGVEEA